MPTNQTLPKTVLKQQHTVAELDDVAAHEAAFDTAQYSAKIYHPYGGAYHGTIWGGGYHHC